MRRLVLVLGLALVLPTVAAGADDPVVAAAKRTASAKSATFEMSMTTALAGQRMTMTGTGAQKGTDAKMSLRMRAGGTAMRFDAVLLQERGSYVMYMRSPIFQAQLPPGKTWIRIDLSKQTASLGLDFGSLVSASQTYAPLEKGLISTTRLGREVVAGQPATRYRAVVDIKRAARALPAYGKQIAAIERASGIRLGRTSYDVWVGGDGRIRRVRYSMPTAAAGSRGSTVSTITFLSFDRPVSIAAPPRSQTVSP